MANNYRSLVQLLTLQAFLFCTAWLEAAAARPRIVTSFLPLYCWTVNVAGTNADVENLLPPRSEPHDYSFTPGDARKLAQADLIVVNDLGLEAWLPKFLKGSPSTHDRIVSVTAGLKSELIAGGPHHASDVAGYTESAHANPHVWLNPQLAAHGVSNILAALQRIDPAHAATYAENARVYITRLQQLDSDIRQKLASVTNRAIVTYHDAFPYFARRYGLEIAGVVEQIPDVNPTPKYLSHLGATIRVRKIPVIFVARGGGTRLARRIASDLRVQLAELDTLETGPLSPSAYEQQMLNDAIVLEMYLK